MATPRVGFLEAFDPSLSSWGNYQQRVDYYLTANKIRDADQKKAVFLTVIGTVTFDLLLNLISPDNLNNKTLDELKTVLTNHFEPKPLVIAERFRFYNLEQTKTESINDFNASVRHHARHCEFGNFLDEALRDRFVCGLRSESIQKRLLSEANLTLTRAVEIANGMESANKNAKELHKHNGNGESEVDLHAVNNKHVHKNSSSQRGNNYQGSSRNNSPSKCFRCGREGHFRSSCQYGPGVKCDKCGGRGHLALACQNKKGNVRVPRQFEQRQSTHMVHERHTTSISEESEGEEDVLHVEVNNNKESPRKSTHVAVKVILNGHPLNMEIDTGSPYTIIGKDTWGLVGSPKLKSTDIQLQSYGNHALQVLGEAVVPVIYLGEQWLLQIIVVNEAGARPLFGRSWLRCIPLNWSQLFKVNHIVPEQKTNVPPGLEALLERYKSLFLKGLGKCTLKKAKFVLKSGAQPKFFKPRPVPYALKEKIEQDLKRLENEGVITKINHADYAAPIVPVIKPTGAVRICGDFKVTVNQQLDVDQYPLPNPEDIFAQLNDGQKFSSLDMAEAYLQMLLEDDSKRLAVINTHLGLFQYNRLPFGISSAPAIFQQLMDQVLQGIEGVIAFLDDILVTGRTDEEHLHNLEEVFERLEKYGLRLKREKCKFFQTEVKYLGRVINKDGIKNVKEKVDAVQKIPSPKDQPELRSFVGMINHYGQFIPNLSSEGAILNDLLKKNVDWFWSSEHESAFVKLKSLLSSDTVLTHFNPNLPIGLACDASDFGIGAVLFHKFPDGSERPIAYASKTLTIAERHYSQIEKEGLGLVFGVKKFHKYLYGRSFLLVTDHKPLLTIFGPNKMIPAIAASRLQRWAIVLAAYKYEMEYKPTAKHGNADMLSRLPVGEDTEFERKMSLQGIVCKIHENSFAHIPISSTAVGNLTAMDPELSQVLKFVVDGWPRERLLDARIRLYAKHALTLSAHKGCIMFANRVVIPEALQKGILTLLHESHQGIVRTKSTARQYVWWPGLNKDIENLVKECQSCSENSASPPEQRTIGWEDPNLPWGRLHIDFAGPFQKHMWLVVVDAHTKWAEVVKMGSTSSERTIVALKSMFARFGIPRVIVSDNGPQFVSKEFSQFCKSLGIRNTTISPYHPKSNGSAERFVQTFKNAMKRAGDSNKEFNLYNFLLNYRTTPHCTTGKTPSEMLLGRRVLTKLDLLNPLVEERWDVAGSSSIVDDFKFRKFKVGDLVWARNYSSGPNFTSGVVTQVVGPLSYKVLMDTGECRRHADQLKRRESSKKSKVKEGEKV